MPDAEFVLALKAVIAACEDADRDPRTIDGLASYSNDRTDPSRLAAALGLKRQRSTKMRRGGCICAAIANGAEAIVAGLADTMIVFRAPAQGQFGRFSRARATRSVAGEHAYQAPYRLISPAQRFAMKVRRFMHEHDIGQDALRAIALASYHHAQANPCAVMQGRPLDAAAYDPRAGSSSPSTCSTAAWRMTAPLR